MSESRTKYGSISTDALIRAIQRSHQEVAAPHWQTHMSAKRNKQIKKELAEMRIEAIDRLSGCDRTNQKFFPISALISYNPNPEEFKTRTGKVRIHAKENKLLVQLDGDSFFMEVEPKYCTLLFIRPTFL